MRAFEFLIEYGSRKGLRHHKYRDGKKPPWYEKAVKLKRDNPRMTAREIGKQVGSNLNSVLIWLIGKPDSRGNIYNDNPPFTMKDFPHEGNRKYFDGEKPWWYEQAIAMRKQGMTWRGIADKLSTQTATMTNWLIKGRKHESGKLINPDAQFEPRPYNTNPINTDLLKELILDRYTDEQIIERIADEKGDKIAGQVRAMLPQLRKKLNPGTEVRNKVTGDDISGFVQENFSD
jgi:transposase